MQFIVSASEKNQRLDQFLNLKEEIPLSRSQIKKLIQDGLVKVNDQLSKSSYRLKKDDKIEIEIPLPKKIQALPEKIPLNIVSEDSDIVVVNKPRGMVVHPAAGNYTGTLVNALLEHCQDLSGIGGVLRPGIVHRLDKFTSGLIVVAKNDFSHQKLAEQFKNRKVYKKYIALVHGQIKDDEGVIKAGIGRHPVDRKKMAVSQIQNPKSKIKKREAVTLFKVVQRYKNYSLVELVLKTGRTHQIRVHMKHLGHPVVGDPLYGKKDDPLRAHGQLLHSAQLGIYHPRTNKYMEFDAKLPDDMVEFIKKVSEK